MNSIQEENSFQDFLNIFKWAILAATCLGVGTLAVVVFLGLVFL